jgi:6-phosphofructokinase
MSAHNSTTPRPSSYITLLAPNLKAFQDTIDFYVRTAAFACCTTGQLVDDVGMGSICVPSSPAKGAAVPTANAKQLNAGDKSAWLTPAMGNSIHVVYLAVSPAPMINLSPVADVNWDDVILGTWSGVDLQRAQLALRHMRCAFKVFSDPASGHLAITARDPLGNTITLNNAHAINEAPNLFHNSYEVPALHPESCFDFAAVPEGSQKRIAILCSGGDSCGMNAAVRSIVRVALQRGCIPFAVYEGYQGLVEGGSKICQMGWEHVRGFLSKGGTVIGTARCARFRERAGRLDAACNMIKNGIDALVVVGGDGSLTGADIMRSEWQGLCDELVATERLKAEEVAHLREHLAIVGMVGSIDNDMSSTDITIGAMSALHRICESVDSLISTANSHRRAFVVEVMGRHCGWLALMAAIAVGAETVFLPERPPPFNTEKYNDDWETEMCDTVKQYRAMGNRKSLVIVCEGAIDRHLNPIKADDVKRVLEQRLNLDTRVTQLGHVQRGGAPCAYDRYLATVQGVEAVNAVLEATPDTIPPMIGISQNKITSVPLMEAVKLTHGVSAAIAQKDFARAMELRDPDFASAFQAFEESTRFDEILGKLPVKQRIRVGILHTGAPAGGMNAATRVAARLCLNRGHTPLAIRNGFSGLVRDEMKPMNWQDVMGWQVKGGSELGTNRDHPQPLPNALPKISPKGTFPYCRLCLIVCIEC